MLPQLTLEKFSGPLDLLLSLIHEEKLDISEVAIGSVTEQFMQYLDTLEDRRAEELADFLIVAARLILIKSQALLPQFSLTEEDEGPTLADQLRLYQQFVVASRGLNTRWMSGRSAVFRIEPPRRATTFVPPSNVSLDALHERMVQLISRLTPPKPLPQTHIDRAVSMKQKLDHIRSLLSSKKPIHFRELLSAARSRTDVIVSFLAILELVKQRTVALKQDETFGDIVISKVRS